MLTVAQVEDVGLQAMQGQGVPATPDVGKVRQNSLVDATTRIHRGKKSLLFIP